AAISGRFFPGSELFRSQWSTAAAAPSPRRACLRSRTLSLRLTTAAASGPRLPAARLPAGAARRTTNHYIPAAKVGDSQAKLVLRIRGKNPRAVHRAPNGVWQRDTIGAVGHIVYIRRPPIQQANQAVRLLRQRLSVNRQPGNLLRRRQILFH